MADDKGRNKKYPPSIAIHVKVKFVPKKIRFSDKNGTPFVRIPCEDTYQDGNGIEKHNLIYTVLFNEIAIIGQNGLKPNDDVIFHGRFTDSKDDIKTFLAYRYELLPSD